MRHWFMLNVVYLKYLKVAADLAEHSNYHHATFQRLVP